jgi:hypothetical protein
MARLINARICLLFTLGLLECLCASLLLAGEPAVPALLWRDMSAEALVDQPIPPRKPWVIRERPITFDPQLLAILKDAGARPHPPITIELFDSVQYQLEVTSTLSKFNDSAVIRGFLKGPARGEVILLVNGTVVAGTIQIGERLFKVEHVSNGRHRLLELDPAKVPPE